MPAELRAYNPSLRDRIAWAIAGGAGKLGAGRYAQQDIAHSVGGLLDFIPGVGDTLAFDDAARSAEAGNWQDAVIQGGLATVGLLPGVGDVAAKAGKGLRARYLSALYEAAPGKDISRIKLTPERVEAAKRSLKDGIDTWHSVRARRQPSSQMQQAQDFARQMLRRGEDVRFKTPNGDGRGSSHYVRVGDKGTVRFSDHPQPYEGSKLVGGFSKELGRRHFPAEYSVAPSEMTLDEVLSLFTMGGR